MATSDPREKAFRKAYFRDIARDIIHANKYAKMRHGASDIGRLIASALEKAFQQGIRVANDPSLSFAPVDTETDIPSYDLVPRRHREAFMRLGFMAFVAKGGSHGDGIENFTGDVHKHALIQEFKVRNSMFRLHVVLSKNNVYSEHTIGFTFCEALVRLGLLDDFTECSDGKLGTSMTDLGKRTYLAWVRETGSRFGR